MKLLEPGKYDRQERITWWNQSALLKSRVLVVGAGALGNEIVKNLALVGVGHIDIVDMDYIEHTNLARCIFFRAGDENMAKAEILAKAAKSVNNDIETKYYVVPVQRLGNAFLADYDLVIAGLDNREARIWLGATLRRLGKIWIDGAIEGLMGKVQVFVPDGPCYACSMTEQEWKILAHRRSCSLIGIDEMLGGHAPTNATTSSIIAGIQSQEAIKYLVGRKDLGAVENRVFRIIGEQMATFMSTIDIDEDCPFHSEPVEIVKSIALPNTIGELWEVLKLSEGDYLSFFDDFVVIEGCVECDLESILGYADLMKNKGKCPSCEEELQVKSFNRITRSDDVVNLRLKNDFFPYKSLVEIISEESFVICLEGVING
ncbi:MAG: ThiF family adenylyltransferase [Actinomycetales bacterium]|nr:MAG: ThiF family adenylyltransferase [Actinomycetales bacterium]